MKIAAYGWMGLLMLGACGVEPGEVPLRKMDYARFAAEVQPVYQAGCGNPACHGRADRPFSVYTTLGWRADPTRTYFYEPLSEEEVRHNFETSRAMSVEGRLPKDTLLLRKPLEQNAGTYHGGGAIFDGVFHPDYLVIESWLLEERE